MLLISNIKKYILFFIVLAIVLAGEFSVLLSQNLDDSIRIIRLDKIGQKEKIKKDENYQIIYGKANPENTRIKYILSDKADEYFIELVHFDDLVKKRLEKAENKPKKDNYDSIYEENENLKQQVDMKNNLIQDDKKYIKEIETRASKGDKIINKIGDEDLDLLVLDKLHESLKQKKKMVNKIDEKYNLKANEQDKNQKEIEVLKQRLKYLSDSGANEQELLIIQKELEMLENMNLNLEREKNILDIEKCKLQKNIEIIEYEISAQKRYRNFLLIIAALIMLFALVVIRSYLIKRKTNKILDEKNIEINKSNTMLRELNNALENKNQEIYKTHKQLTDSIDYASKIQNAILPFDNRVKEFVDDYFVLFKPKDVVSGDFYWMEKVGDYKFIAVVDCTGHGVPGAFMSIIGFSLLNHLVKDKNIFDPAKILEELHLGIRKSLQQKGKLREQHDGMEVCLIRISENEIIFSGANRPLWYIQDGEFYQIKGDRHPIGGKQKEIKREFTNHKLEIKEEIKIYLTTDGYADQNNPENENYGLQRLRETIHRIAGLKMKKQKIALINDHLEFACGEKNRDDILILGMEINYNEEHV